MNRAEQPDDRERPAALPAENEDDGGRLTDELLEEKLEEAKGPLPFVPGADGDKIEPPMPETEGYRAQIPRATGGSAGWA
jgi:hypothetical protein